MRQMRPSGPPRIACGSPWSPWSPWSLEVAPRSPRHNPIPLSNLLERGAGCATGLMVQLSDRAHGSGLRDSVSVAGRVKPPDDLVENSDRPRTEADEVDALVEWVEGDSFPDERLCQEDEA